MIRAQGLRLAVESRVLITDLTWNAQIGETWCVLGPNGSGKTTLLNTLAGLRLPQAGTLYIADRDLSAVPTTELARLRAYCPLTKADPFPASVRDTVLLGRFPYLPGFAWHGDDDLEVVRHALADMDIADLATRNVQALSAGERRRVAIATMITQETPVWLLDEPTANLDIRHQQAVLRRLAVQRDKLVIYSSHELNVPLRFATHVLLLYGDGRYALGSAHAVLTTENLSLAYGHEIAAITDSGDAWFVPK